MSKSFASNRELAAEALRFKAPEKSDGQVLIATNLQFKPSQQSVKEAEEVRERLRSRLASAHT